MIVDYEQLSIKINLSSDSLKILSIRITLQTLRKMTDLNKLAFIALLYCRAAASLVQKAFFLDQNRKQQKIGSIYLA
jgi:hypothetical protein